MANRPTSKRKSTLLSALSGITFEPFASRLRTVFCPATATAITILRRILRRGIRYGRALGFSEPFFHRLAPALIEQMKETFPELGERAELIEKTLCSEEESFNKTLDRGIELFAREADAPEGRRRPLGRIRLQTLRHLWLPARPDRIDGP